MLFFIKQAVSNNMIESISNETTQQNPNVNIFEYAYDPRHLANSTHNQVCC